jgi:hypothetical protein
MLVSPGAILIGIFGLLPVLMALRLSFQKSDLLTPDTPWVGTKNYRQLADDPRFAVVAMITDAGTGGGYAAPAVREIYEAIYGLTGKPAALPDGKLPKPPKVLR